MLQFHAGEFVAFILVGEIIEAYGPLRVTIKCPHYILSITLEIRGQYFDVFLELIKT